MNFTQLKNLVQCLTDRVLALEEGGVPPSEGGGLEIITSPDVSTYDDSRGSVGAISYNLTLNGGTKFEKVSESPHTWVSMPFSFS